MLTGTPFCAPYFLQSRSPAGPSARAISDKPSSLAQELVCAAAPGTILPVSPRQEASLFSGTKPVASLISCSCDSLSTKALASSENPGSSVSYATLCALMSPSCRMISLPHSIASRIQTSLRSSSFFFTSPSGVNRGISCCG